MRRWDALADTQESQKAEATENTGSAGRLGRSVPSHNGRRQAVAVTLRLLVLPLRRIHLSNWRNIPGLRWDEHRVVEDRDFRLWVGGEDHGRVCVVGKVVLVRCEAD